MICDPGAVLTQSVVPVTPLILNDQDNPEYRFTVYADCSPEDCTVDGSCWDSVQQICCGIPVSNFMCEGIDYNGDGLFPDTQDIDDLLSVFGGGLCSTGMCGSIDINNDGLFPDTLDIDAFLSIFAGGPCLL